VGKYARAKQATDDNMAHARCMLDTLGICNAFFHCNFVCINAPVLVIHI